MNFTFQNLESSHETQFQAGFITHHVHAPGGLPDQFHIDLFDPRQRFDRIGHPAGHFPGDGAPRCGQGHDNVHGIFFIYINRIDQAQIIDIDRNFGIEDRLASGDDLIVKRMLCA